MTEVALLAPVPEIHLYSGVERIASSGRVAFGSMAWKLFRELQGLSEGQHVDAYLYASKSKKFGPPKVRWKGRYVRYVEAVNGSHPDGMIYRPQSTQENVSDNTGHWAVFWELDVLEELGKEEAIPMSLFRGLHSKKSYVSSFRPEGPILIEAL